MPAELKAHFETSRPLDLPLTLGPLGHGPWLWLAPGEAWRASHTPDGASTVHLVQSGTRVDVEAWGPGAAWAAAHAPALCGEDDDDSGFVPGHQLLIQAHKRHPGLRIPKTHAVFEALVPAIIGQKVTGREAGTSYRALVQSLGMEAPGPVQLTVPPPSNVLARTPYWTFHRFGIERRRAESIVGAARSAARLEETLAMDMPAAHRRLDAFPGVGPWTVATVALVALGDADAVPVGDYNLPHAVGYALEGTPRSTDERMLELLDPYRGHRARVIRLIGIAGVTAPRFGPRMPLRNFVND